MMIPLVHLLGLLHLCSRLDIVVVVRLLDDDDDHHSSRRRTLLEIGAARLHRALLGLNLPPLP